MGKKRDFKRFIPILFFIIIGFFCGLFIGNTHLFEYTLTGSVFAPLITLFILFIALMTALFIQIIIHESGHLIFGLISGYIFCSFRISSFMWVREDDKIRFRRYSLSSSGGQCLMTPPPMNNGSFPLVLYNLGGSILNTVSGIVFLILHLVFSENYIISDIMLLLSVTGFATAAMNGIPLNTEMISNDGYNAFALKKSGEAMRSFWLQLTINEQVSNGIRLKEMPEEWFYMPDDEEMKNSMTSVMGVYYCNRLMDEKRFEEADAEMLRIMSNGSNIIGIYRYLMVCDRLYIEMISQRRHTVLEMLLTDEQRKAMKQLKSTPSVIRTQYAFALLCERDGTKAMKLKKSFERLAKSYPYQGEITAERELIELADKAL